MEETTQRLIHNQNEHWATKKLPERLKETKKREKYYQILDYLKEKQILSIIGLRRTGKTTIMFQLMDHLLQNNVNPNYIFYFSFDELTTKQPEIIEEIIQYYFSSIIKKDIVDIKKERCYIFLDEIQKVDNWQAILKRYYDLKYNIKFIVSGSESMIIKKKTKESLAGRTFDFTLHPLFFKEYLKFKNFIIERGTYKALYNSLITQHVALQSHFEEFILNGGFPETLDLKIEKLQEYINNSVIEKILFTDIPIYFEITNPELLLKILEIIGANTSDLFELTQITDTLNISRNTASSYLFYLESAFLVNLSYNFTKSKVKQLRTRRKAYLTDTGIINTILKRRKLDSPDELGKLVETQIHNELARNLKINFWRDKAQHEIDIVIKDKDILPIEVKYKNIITKKDLRNMEFFLEKYKIKNGIIVTKDKFEYTKRIQYIPAWLFLLGDLPIR